MGKYQEYPEYNESGVEWIGHIPSHWQTASISKLFNIKAGGDVKQEYFSKEKTEECPYPIYTNANDERAVYGYTSKCFYQANSITVSGRGYVGFSVYRDHAYDAIIRLLVLSPFGQRDCKFFTYFINAVIDFRVESSAIGQLSTTQIAPYKIAFPSYAEQEQITAFLDHETAKIDHLIAKQEWLIELLKEKRQAVISHAVTRGLNPDAPMKDSGVEWLGEVPAHWVTCRTKHLLNFVTSGSRGWAQFYSDEGDIFVRITNLTRDGISVNLNDLQHVLPPKGSEGERSKVRENDLLISITADLGSVGVANNELDGAYVSQHVALARPNRRVGSSRWFGYALIANNSKKQFEASGYGGTKIQLNLEDIREIEIPHPPPDEQAAIANYIDEKLDRYDLLIGKVLSGIDFMKEHRAALISASVTGKIDVRGWQKPNTEPEETVTAVSA